MTTAKNPQKVSTASAPLVQGEPARKYVATAPNQIWTWGVSSRYDLFDIGLYLFVCEDIYSRYVVGFKLYTQNNEDIAIHFVDCVLEDNNIGPSSGLVLHSSHGKVMQSEKMLALLKERGVEVAPKRRGDKPYISGWFSSLNKMLAFKISDYSYTSLDYFKECVEEAVNRYNHLPHNKINHVSPLDRYEGKDAEILAKRNKAHLLYKQAHPERFISGKVKIDVPAGPQYLNKADAE